MPPPPCPADVTPRNDRMGRRSPIVLGTRECPRSHLFSAGGFFVCCSPRPNPIFFRDDDEEGNGEDDGAATVGNKEVEGESGTPLAVAESASPGEGQGMISVRDEEEPPSALDPPTSSMVEAKVY